MTVLSSGKWHQLDYLDDGSCSFIGTYLLCVCLCLFVFHWLDGPKQIRGMGGRKWNEDKSRAV